MLLFKELIGQKATKKTNEMRFEEWKINASGPPTAAMVAATPLVLTPKLPITKDSVAISSTSASHNPKLNIAAKILKMAKIPSISVLHSIFHKSTTGSD